MKLSDIENGEVVRIVAIRGNSSLLHRLSEMGFITGQRIKVVKNAPFQDPIEYQIMGYEVSLRREEAEQIEVTRERPLIVPPTDLIHPADQRQSIYQQLTPIREVQSRITVALVGNPNCGKTSLFNHVAGMNEHVGNYSGVTVQSKEASIEFEGYTITFVDLPGTYSIADFSPEERVVADYIHHQRPDIIINVVDATNLERNLYLTTQLIDMGERVILSLNMWDDFLHSGDHLKQKVLSKLLGMPIVPTIAKRGRGIAALLDQIVKSYTDPCSFEGKWVNYPDEIETFIEKSEASTRYDALLQAETDPTLDKLYQRTYDTSVQAAIATARYAFVSGALKECYTQARRAITTPSSKIDNVLTHKYWGLPIFIGILYLTFYATFTLGGYPMEWIENGVAWLRELVNESLPMGAFKDLIVSGIIDGVGSVIVFLPNILILFLFISIMEDTGYMARAAFITDKLMHRIGLHGKSFIPLIMGFGCNVPAIMATRTIENKGNRLQTMLITPFMSCSARLPVYILIVGTFFPGNEGNMLFAIYLAGIVLGIITSLILKNVFFRKSHAHFVMELPPYRIPTARSTVKHMWNKGSQYLKKMGGVILIAAVIIWALGYFPNGSNDDGTPKKSYLQTVGHAIEPVIAPLGFDWQMGVSLMSGVVAKEVVVSSMSVIYNTPDSDNPEHDLSSILRADNNWNTSVALSFLTFVLIYFPCIASVSAIGRESGTWKWAFFTVVYTTGMAWLASFLVYNTALLFT